MQDFENWLKARGGEEWVAEHHIYLKEKTLRELIDMDWTPGIPNILKLNGVEYKGREANELLDTIARGRVYWDITNNAWYPVQVGAHITALYKACEAHNISPETMAGMFKAGKAWKENADQFIHAMATMKLAFSEALEKAECKPAVKTRKKLSCDIWEPYKGISSLSKFDKIKTADGAEYQVKDLGTLTVIVWGDSRSGSKIVSPVSVRKLKRHWEAFVEGTYIFNGNHYFKRVKGGCVDVGVCPEGFVEGEGGVLRTYVEGWPCGVEEVPVEVAPQKRLMFSKWLPAYGHEDGKKVAKFKVGDTVRLAYNPKEYLVHVVNDSFVVGQNKDDGLYSIIEPTFVRVPKCYINAHQADTYFTDGAGRYWVKEPINGARCVTVDSEGVVIEESENVVYDYPKEAYICEVEKPL